MGITNPVLVLSSDNEAPKVIVLPLIPKAQREEVEHSFQREEEEVFSLATVMPPRLLKIRVKPGTGQEEQASLPAIEVESSHPAVRQQKRSTG